MNLKAKTALIIIITLVIGIIIGALLNRALLQHRIRKAFSMRNPGFFITVFEDIIQPDADQRKRLIDVLDKHGERMAKIRENSRDELESEFETMRKEIDSILTPEQKKRLEKRLPGPFRRMRRFPPHKKPFGERPKKAPPKEQRQI